MTQANHSPTPWKIRHTAQSPKQDENYTVVDVNSNAVAYTFPPDLYPSAKTNAEFIVRACNSHHDLLAALKEAENALARCYDVTEWPANGESSQDSALAIVRKAIAKAEGK